MILFDLNMLICATDAAAIDHLKNRRWLDTLIDSKSAFAMRLASYLLILICFGGLRQTANGQRQIQLLGHEDNTQISDIVFSPNGELFASSASDGVVLIWNANTGELLKKLEHMRPIEHVQFSPDGRQLATSQHRAMAENNSEQYFISVSLWDTASWETKDLRFATKLGGRVQFEFLRNGDIITSIQEGRNGGCRIERWTPYSENKQLIFESARKSFTSLVVSPDGKWLAGASTPPMLWDTEDFSHPKIIRGAVVAPLAFSMDSRFVAGCESGGTNNDSPSRVNLWSVKDVRLVGSLPGFVGRVSAMSFSRDNRYLAATATMPGSWGEVYGEKIQIWDLNTGEQRLLEQNTYARGLDFSPTADVLATSFATPRPGIRLWDSKSGQATTTINFGEPRKNVIVKLRFSPRGDRFATVAEYSDRYERLCIWEVNE